MGSVSCAHADEQGSCADALTCPTWLCWSALQWGQAIQCMLMQMDVGGAEQLADEVVQGMLDEMAPYKQA